MLLQAGKSGSGRAGRRVGRLERLEARRCDPIAVHGGWFCQCSAPGFVALQAGACKDAVQLSSGAGARPAVDTLLKYVQGDVDKLLDV